ncbi:unnamed protein product, partial [Schistosoma turkestanicum]
MWRIQTWHENTYHHSNRSDPQPSDDPFHHIQSMPYNPNPPRHHPYHSFSHNNDSIETTIPISCLQIPSSSSYTNTSSNMSDYFNNENTNMIILDNNNTLTNNVMSNDSISLIHKNHNHNNNNDDSSNMNSITDCNEHIHHHDDNMNKSESMLLLSPNLVQNHTDQWSGTMKNSSELIDTTNVMVNTIKINNDNNNNDNQNNTENNSFYEQLNQQNADIKSVHLNHCLFNQSDIYAEKINS